MPRTASLAVASSLALAVAACHGTPRREASPAAPAVSRPVDPAAVVARVRRAFRAGPAGHEARGPSWSARIDPRGALSFSPAAPDATAVVLETAAISRGGPLRPAVVRAGGDGGVAIDRGAAVERVRPSAAGVEQSWEVAVPPRGGGDLVVRVRASGMSLAAATASGLHFAPPGGGPGVRYGHATWIDAAGRRTAVLARLDRGDVVLAVPGAVVDAAAYPAVLDPIVSPESAVDVPLVAGAPGAQVAPAIASDGGVSLVAWTDLRSGDSSDVWAARVADDGTILDPVGILVGVGITPRTCPAAAAGPGGFLVAWISTNLADGPRIAAAPVPPSGAAGPAIPVGNALSALNTVSVAWDGAGFRVAWSSGDVSYGSKASVQTARVSADGATASATTVLAWTAYPGERVATACARPGCAVAWVTYDGISAVQLDAGGAVVAPGPRDLSSTWRVGAPAATFDGAGYLFAWEDDRARTGEPLVFGARMALDGGMPDAGGVPLTAGPAYAPALASGGGVTLLAFEERGGSGADVRALRLSPLASPLDPAPFALGEPAARSQPAVAFDGAAFVVAYADVSTDFAGDVAGTRVAPDGSVGATARLSSSASRETRPVVAFDGTAWLVAWEDARDTDGGASTIRAVRLATDGSPLDAAPIVVSAGPGVRGRPAVAGCAGGWVVAWEDHRGATAPDVFAARVSAEGTVLDPDGLAIAAAAGTDDVPAVACGPAGALVAFEHTAGSAAELRVARLAPGGAVLDPGGVVLSSGDTAARPDVAADADGFVVVWRSGPASAAGPVAAARVAPGGAIAALPPPCAIPALGPDPRIARGASGFMVAWGDARNGTGQLRQTVLSAAGAPLAPCGAEIPAAAGGDARLAFDGARQVLAWIDAATGALRGTALTERGGSLGDFEIAPAAARAASPALACGGGRCLVAYQRADGAQGVARVAVRTIAFDAPAPRCGSPGDCASGFCVDGVCCDIACGGGDPDDCVACSVAAGAPVDGTCAPVVSGQLCRSSAAACDAGARCTGDAGASACPASAVVADATPCDDGDACTFGDVCSAGACTGRAVTCSSFACNAGSCDAATGACRYDPSPAGTPCDDGNRCTVGETCSDAGSCGGGTPKCRPSDECHVAACDYATGACSEAPAPDGTACDDHSLCTAASACRAGVCTGTSAVVCPPPDACHRAGLCDRATGLCVYANAPDGTSCDDGDACTRVDTCQAGACRGSDPVTCPAGDACRKDGACDPATGTCVQDPRPEGTPCDDGDGCTVGDACAAGACAAGAAVTCAAADACHVAGTCDPASGSCSTPAAPDGTPCPGGHCAAGACAADPPPKRSGGCGSAPGDAGSAIGAIALLALAVRRRRPRAA